MPATTNNLTRAIINFLLHRGHFAFRVNNGAVYDPVKRVFRRRRKNDPAIADIHCTLAGGRSFWIEVKNANTKDTIKSGQILFSEEIKNRDGLHCFAKSYQHFLHFYWAYACDPTIEGNVEGLVFDSNGYLDPRP